MRVAVGQTRPITIHVPMAKRKGLDKRRWAATCFFFAPALIGLALAKSHQRPGDTEAF